MKFLLMCQLTYTSGLVLTGLELLTLVDLVLAIVARVARFANTRVLINTVNTRGSVLTRVTLAFVNVRLAIGT